MDKISKNYRRNILDSEKFLTLEEIKNLLGVIDNRLFLGVRDYAIIKLFLATGLRRSELLGLNVMDYQKSGEIARIRFTAKGGQIHTMMIPQGDTIEAINRYLKWWGLARSKDLEDEIQDQYGRQPMFQSAVQVKPLLKSKFTFYTVASKKRMSDGALDHMFRKYRKKMGLKKRLTPHVLRHSSGSWFYHHSQNLAETQQFMRHKNIASTLIYLHSDLKKVAEIQKLMYD